MQGNCENFENVRKELREELFDTLVYEIKTLMENVLNADKKNAYQVILAFLSEEVEKHGKDIVARRLKERAENFEKSLWCLMNSENSAYILTVYLPYLIGEICIPLNDEG